MFKPFLRFIFLVLFLIGGTVAFAPNLLSTKLGKTCFVKIYTASTGHFLNIEDLSISWKSGIEVKQISFKSKNITVESPLVTSNASLWGIIFHKDLKIVHVSMPTITIQESTVSKRSYLQAGFFPSVTLPLPKLPYLGQYIVENGSIDFFRLEEKVAEFQPLKLDITLLSNQIKIKGGGVTLYNSIKGAFAVNVVYNSQKNFELSATLNNFPIYIADRFAGMYKPSLQNLLIDGIGETLNCTLFAKKNCKTIDFYCQAKSEKLFTDIEAATKDNTVFLVKPAIIHFELPKLPLISPLTPFKGQWTINALSFPVGNLKNVSFEAVFKGGKTSFSFGTVEPFTIFTATDNLKKGDCVLEITSDQVQLQSKISIPNNWDELVLEGYGEFFNHTICNFSAKTLSSVEVSLKGDVCQGSVSCGYDREKNEIFLKTPASFTYVFSQLPKPCIVAVEKPFPLHVTIDPCLLSLPKLNGKINATISLEEVKTNKTTIEKTTISVIGQINKKKATFSLNSTISEGGEIKGSGSFQWPKTIAGNLYLKKVPTELFSLFSTSDFQSFLGDFVNASIDASSLKKTADLSLTSPLTKIQLSCIKKGDWIELAHPTTANFTITKQGYEAINQLNNGMKNPFVLEDPFDIEASIPSFQWNIATKEILYRTKILINRVVFSHPQTSQNKKLINFQLLLHHIKPSEWDFSIKTTAASSHFSQGFASIQGVVDPSLGFLQLNSRLQNFPTEMVDFLLQSWKNPQFSITHFVGSTINLQADAEVKNYNGNVELEFQSPNIKASCDGAIVDGVLTLKKPMSMKIYLVADDTPPSFYKPFSIHSLESNRPIMLEISDNDFSWPLFQKTTMAPTMATGFVDCGKIICYNQGVIFNILKLLTLSTDEQKNSVELWFAPIDFSVKQGQLSLKRTEILVNNKYQICLFGDVDWIKNQADLTVGLTASCLAKALGINNLSNDYVLCLPLNGPINHIALDTKTAIAKIGVLLLWKHESIAEDFTRPFGKILKNLRALPDAHTKVPPSRPPFPWK